MWRMPGHTFRLNHVHCTFSVLAASSIANIVKSSLGRGGLDKMLVDDVGVSRFLLSAKLSFLLTLGYHCFVND